MSYLYHVVGEDLGPDALAFMMEDLRQLERSMPKDDDFLDPPPETERHFHIRVDFSCHSAVFCTLGGVRCPRDSAKLQVIRDLIVNVEAYEMFRCVICLKEMENRGSNAVDGNDTHEWSLSRPFKMQAKGKNLATGITQIYGFVDQLARYLLWKQDEGDFDEEVKENTMGARFNYWYDGRTDDGALDKTRPNHPPEVHEGWNANTLVLCAAWWRAMRGVKAENPDFGET